MRLSYVRGKVARRRNANCKRRFKLRAMRARIDELNGSGVYAPQIQSLAPEIRELFKSLFSLDDKGRVVVKGERGRTPLVDPQYSTQITEMISL